MSDNPETLADILADYRADIPAMTSGKLPHPTPEYLRILLDRIEAAAKRRCATLEDALSHCRGSRPTRDYFLFCNSCMEYGPKERSIDSAIAAWNRRAGEDKP